MKEKTHMNNKIIISISIAAIVLVAAVFMFQRQPQPMYAFVAPTRGVLAEEVKVQGTVKPAADVQLAFQVAGKVDQVKVKVGDKVKAGQVLATLSSSDVRADMAQSGASVAMAKAQLQQLEAGLELQKVKKKEMLRGARPEEVGLAQTQVSNAQKALADAQLNLDNVKNKAAVDYHNAQNNINTLLQDAYTKANDAVNRQTSVLYLNSNSDNPKFIPNSTMNSSAGKSAEEQRPAAIAALNKLQHLATSVNADFSNAPQVANDTSDQLQILWSYLDVVMNAINSSVATAELPQAQIDADRVSISSAMSSLNNSKSAFSNYSQAVMAVKSGNATTIQGAEIAVTGAKNALNIANDGLIIKKEGATAEQIASQDAVIRQAESALAMQRAQIMAVSAAASKTASQIDKTIIKAPIDGQITVVNPKVGETVAPSQPAISMMTVAKFQIESYVTEADLAKLQIGSLADVTLDTYGSAKRYQAKVIAIDPAATLIKGNTTYKITSEFTKEDTSIKSGFTANLEVVVKKEDNALIIPESAIIKEGDNHYVIVDNKTTTGERRSIKIGLTTSDGRVSVLEGLRDNEQVADFSTLAVTK